MHRILVRRLHTPPLPPQRIKAEKLSWIRKALPPRIRTSPRPRWTTYNTTTARPCTTRSRTPHCAPRTSASSQAARAGSSRSTSRSSPTRGTSTTRSSWPPKPRSGTLAYRGPERSSIAPTTMSDSAAAAAAAETIKKRVTWTSIPSRKAGSTREGRAHPRRISSSRIIGTMGSCWAVETSGP